MLAISTSKECPFTCPAPSLGMAIETLATDPCGLCWPYEGKNVLNSSTHSKWLEAVEMSSTSAASTIPHLRSLFARFGLPEQCVSDNGPPFNSEDFATFMKGNGIKQIRCSPYQMAWLKGLCKPSRGPLKLVKVMADQCIIALLASCLAIIMPPCNHEPLTL